MLHVQPKKVLMDEKVTLRITKLKSAQKVTVRCELVEKTSVYESYAHYVASLNGEVNLSKDLSFGGSYVGVDFSYMLPINGQKIGLRYMPANVMKPVSFKIQVYDGHLCDHHFSKNDDHSSNNKHQPLVEDFIQKYWCRPGVTRHEVNHRNIRGTIFKPSGKGPFKGVIDIYVGAGGVIENRVSLLASHGFIAFNLAYHNYKDLPKKAVDVPIKYFVNAVDYFASLDSVLPGVAVVGFSLGGVIALHLSALTKKISTVITISSAPYFPFQILKDCQVYSKPEKVVDSSGQLRYTHKDKRGGIIPKGLVHDESIDHLLANITKYSAKYVFVMGEDDKLIDPHLSSQKYVDKMRACGKENDIQVLIYPNAGHFIDPPYMPQTLLHYNATFRQVLASGGELVENAGAAVHSWQQILSFLNKNAGQGIVQSKL